MRDTKPNGSNILASAASGFIELLTFHPLDTLTKRIINNRGLIFAPGKPNHEAFKTLNTIVFRDRANHSFRAKYLSLFPGLQYAVLYKVSQRTFQFGGHPFVVEYLNGRHDDWIKDTFGEKSASLWTNSLAGAIIGIGEVIFLPLDLLKIQGQTAHKNTKFSASQFFNHFKGSASGGAIAGLRTLYRSVGWTAARNAIGCFTLFGTSTFVKQNLFNVENLSNASLSQDISASLIAASTCILISAPFDVVKVRIQAAQIGSKQSGYLILKLLIKTEGPRALFKGLIPKLLIAGPKMAFGYTLSQQLAQFFHKSID